MKIAGSPQMICLAPYRVPIIIKADVFVRRSTDLLEGQLVVSLAFTPARHNFSRKEVVNC